MKRIFKHKNVITTFSYIYIHYFLLYCDTANNVSMHAEMSHFNGNWAIKISEEQITYNDIALCVKIVKNHDIYYSTPFKSTAKF